MCWLFGWKWGACEPRGIGSRRERRQSSNRCNARCLGIEPYPERSSSCRGVVVPFDHFQDRGHAVDHQLDGRMPAPWDGGGDRWRVGHFDLDIVLGTPVERV